jgi:large subunit ribosomal protein L25
VKRSVQHIDFIQVNLNEEIVVSIPIHLEGEAKDVASNNGLVDLAMQELEVRTTPRNIPDGVTIDISELGKAAGSAGCLTGILRRDLRGG